MRSYTAKTVLTSEFFLDEKRFLRGIEGQPDAERIQHFREAVARTRRLAGNRQKTDPNDGEALFALTLAAGMEADASTILEKKHLEGLKRMKEANKYGKELLTQHPNANDAYVALGIANYTIGSLNSGARFALWFDGVRGDKKFGMEQVAKAAEGDRYLQPFAKILLALAARREKQPELATKLGKILATRRESRRISGVQSRLNTKRRVQLFRQVFIQTPRAAPSRDNADPQRLK